MQLPLPLVPISEQYKKLAKDFQRLANRANPMRFAPGSPAGRKPSALQGVDLSPRQASASTRNRGESSPVGKVQAIDERARGARWPMPSSSSPAATLRELAEVCQTCPGGSERQFARFAIRVCRRRHRKGDLETLKALLAENPRLVRQRSTRGIARRCCTVSANGIEDFRQKTPRNIVEITRILLDAGADANAESDAYGGRSTALGLTATSCHPEEAGMQFPLMELLIERGAAINGPDTDNAVNSCLHNGRGQAAEFLANRGAHLDLEGAAGAGRLDVVKSFFLEDGTLKPPATLKQMRAGFGWACEFGRKPVVDFLLRHGMQADIKANSGARETGLHWAAFEGNADIVRMLLEHGAPVDVKDSRFDGTPLGWAIYGWGTSPARTARTSYYEVVALLAQAGARLEPEWYEEDGDRQRAVKRIQSDTRMQAALRGEFTG